MLKYFFILIPLLALPGCFRVNTNPKPLFEGIQREVLEQTGYTICWNRFPQSGTLRQCIEPVLEQPLTPDLAVYIALLNNPQLQAAYEALGVGKAQLAQAGLLTNPLFSVSDRFSTQASVTDLIDIGLFQNFLEILLIPLKKRKAACELQATKAQVTTQIFDVIAQTKSAFYTYQALLTIWELKKEILLASECSYEAAQKLFEAGNIKELEVAGYRLFYEQTKVDLAGLEVEVLKAREDLNVLMGLFGSQICWCAEKGMPSVHEKENIGESIENEAIASSLDLESAKKQLLATAAGYGIDTTRIVFPQFDIGPSSERDESVWFVGPALAIALPFFDWGQAMSAAARAEILRQWNLYTALAIEIRSEARMKRIHLLNAQRQALYAQKVLVPVAERLTTLTLHQLNAMQISVFQLLAAKIQELEKKMELAQFVRDYWIIHTEVQLLLSGHLA